MNNDRWAGRSTTTILGIMLLGASATLPIFVVALESLFSRGLSMQALSDTLLSNYALFNEISGALANSAICAAVSSILGVVLAWVLVFRGPDARALVALTLGLLFFPGLVMALGFQYMIHDLLDEQYTDVGKSVALIVTMIGYIIPYQLLIALDFKRGLPRSERYASKELMGWVPLCRYWVARLRWPSIGMVIVGAALSTTEVHRSQILGTDLFGFGMEYFGPWFVNKFQSTGLTANVFSAIAASLFAVYLLCFYRGQLGLPTIATQRGAKQYEQAALPTSKK
jgi:hypothetical protein